LIEDDFEEKKKKDLFNEDDSDVENDVFA